MTLKERVARLFGRAPSGRAIDLDPLAQCILLTLLRSRDPQFPTLQAEAEANLGVIPARTMLALVKLQAEGLLRRDHTEGAGQHGGAYRLTPAGRRIARLIPPGLRSSIEFRL